MIAALVVLVVLVVVAVVSALLLRVVRHPREHTSLEPRGDDTETERIHGYSERPAGADAEDPPAPPA